MAETTIARPHSKLACYGCSGKLAMIRGVYPRRRLVAAGTIRPVPLENGIVEITCPMCGKVNRFAWRAPVLEKIAS